MILRAILLLIISLQTQAIELLPARAEMQQQAGTFPLGKNLSAHAPTAPAKHIAAIFRDLGVSLQSAPAAQASFVCTIGEVKNPHGCWCLLTPHHSRKNRTPGLRSPSPTLRQRNHSPTRGQWFIAMLHHQRLARLSGPRLHARYRTHLPNARIDQRTNRDHSHPTA